MLSDLRHRSRVTAGAAALALVASACSGVWAAEPGPDGEIVVELTDFRFGPDTIRVKAGDTVTFVLRNVGEHTHEFMVGRDPLVFDDYLNEPIVEPFQEDFFAGIDVTFSGEGMPMNLAGADMGGMEMGDETDAPMEMGDEGPGGVVVEPDGQGEEGGMVMLETDQEARITLTIPEDRVGEWAIGCFEQDGGHFADGMQATLIVTS